MSAAAPRKSVPAISGQRSAVASQRPTPSRPSATKNASGTSARFVESCFRTGSALRARQAPSPDEQERNAIAQQRDEAEQEAEREQRELDVDERRVVHAHRAEVDRVERREEQRMLERQVDVVREDTGPVAPPNS